MFLDSTTPKLDHTRVSYRSSSDQLRRSFSPKLLKKPQPFSKCGALLSKATCQSHDLRDSSGVSSIGSSIGVTHQPRVETKLSSSHWGQDSERDLSELAYQRNRSTTHSSSEATYSLSGTNGSDDTIVDPYLLVPNISITPEVRTVGDGQSSIWVAIEVSGQLFRPSITDDFRGTPGTNNFLVPVHHGGGGLSRYGYLYDMKVDILPTEHSSITDIIDDDTSRYEN